MTYASTKFAAIAAAAAITLAGIAGPTFAGQLRTPGNDGGGGNNYQIGDLQGPGGTSEDTCTQSLDGESCAPDKLAQRCDDAGGGMSSLPGGGIDCDTSHWDD